MDDMDCLDHLKLPAKLYDAIEADVAKLFVELNIHNYPVDPIDIASKLGYELVPFTKINKELKKILLSKDIDGISYYNPVRKKQIIYYRQCRIKERLRFTIGHELGHIRMGHRGESELAKRIADYYSAYLLAPTPWIAHAECEDYSEVAEKFCLSDSCALYCFDRYVRWKNIPMEKKYEKSLFKLLS